jgi:hypothetical protein
MSTLSAFCEITGMTPSKTSVLEITPERQAEIIKAVTEEANRAPYARSQAPTSVSLLPVSTYVIEAKDPDAGKAYALPKHPPFASHWGVLIGTPGSPVSLLLHLLLKTNEDGKHNVVFHARSVAEDDKMVKIAAITNVGNTHYSLEQIFLIGERMVEEFGNYHVVFWNCQTFAKCFLHVLTGNNAAFNQWTSADVTNLFLCALIIPAPLATSKRIVQHKKEKNLETVGLKAVGVTLSNQDEDPSDEDLFRLSDQVINWLIECCVDEEVSKRLESPVKDSHDKVGLLRRLLSLITG